MALIRALVRRGMGKIPYSCPVPPEHELDFLALKIVFHKYFRNFDGLNGGPLDACLLDLGSSTKCCTWKVRTAEPNILFPIPGCATVKTNSVNCLRANSINSSSENISNSSDSFTTIPKWLWADELVSSPQLIRVRARLGYLCGWTNSATEPALALKKSIEHFMQVFFPIYNNNDETGEGATESFNQFEWEIEPLAPNRTVQNNGDLITIYIKREEREGRWKVESSEIEAVLSLWIASIKAEMTSGESTTSPSGSPRQTRTIIHEHADRKRSATVIESSMPYYRILGKDDENGTLRRNVSWWISDQVAEQALNTRGQSDPGRTHDPRAEKIVIGLTGHLQIPQGLKQIGYLCTHRLCATSIRTNSQ